MSSKVPHSLMSGLAISNVSHFAIGRLLVANMRVRSLVILRIHLPHHVRGVLLASPIVPAAKLHFPFRLERLAVILFPAVIEPVSTSYLADIPASKSVILAIVHHVCRLQKFTVGVRERSQALYVTRVGRRPHNAAAFVALR